jgi:WD40 repeat protein
VVSGQWAVGSETVWSAATQRELATLKGFDGIVLGLTFSPDGGLLATAGGDGAIRLWTTASLQQVGEMKGGTPVVFSPDGRELVASVEAGALTGRKVAGAIHR